MLSLPSFSLCKTAKNSILFASLRTHGSPALIDKPWEASLYNLDGLATECEMHQDTSIQRPVSQ